MRSFWAAQSSGSWEEAGPAYWKRISAASARGHGAGGVLVKPGVPALIGHRPSRRGIVRRTSSCGPRHTGHSWKIRPGSPRTRPARPRTAPYRSRRRMVRAWGDSSAGRCFPPAVPVGTGNGGIGLHRAGRGGLGRCRPDGDRRGQGRHGGTAVLSAPPAAPGSRRGSAEAVSTGKRFVFHRRHLHLGRAFSNPGVV